MGAVIWGTPPGGGWRKRLAAKEAEGGSRAEHRAENSVPRGRPAQDTLDSPVSGETFAQIWSSVRADQVLGSWRQRLADEIRQLHLTDLPETKNAKADLTPSNSESVFEIVESFALGTEPTSRVDLDEVSFSSAEDFSDDDDDDWSADAVVISSEDRDDTFVPLYSVNL